ncbi:MAG: tetratricopeptide repeat protein [Flavobacteriales bacterium]|nr:tetratricopeptide repeat protein [Flavobacteriales bacterium]
MLSLTQKVVLFFCPVVFWSTHCFAQLDSNQRCVLDSLKLQILNAKHDTIVAQSYIEISDIFYPVNKDSSKKYTTITVEFIQEKLTEELEVKEQKVYLDLIDFCYENLGDVAFRKGKFDEAVINYGKCIDIKLEYGRIGLPHIYNKKAAAYIELIDYAAALENSMTSLEWSDKIENPTGKDRTVRGMSYNVIAIIYRRLGDWDKCNEYTLKSLEIVRESGSSMGEAYILNNVGVYYFEKKRDYQLAKKYFKESIELFRKIKHQKGESMLLYNFSRLYFRLDSAEVAEQYLDESILLSQKINDKKNLSAAYWLKGHIHFIEGDLDKAEELALLSYEISKSDEGEKWESKKASRLLVEIYQEKGDWEKAFFYKEEEVKVTDDFRNLENQREVLELEAQYKVKEAKAEDSLTVKTQKLEIESKEEEIENLNQEKKIHRTGLYLVSGGTVVLFGLVLFRIRKYRQSVRIKETKAETEIKNLLNTVNLLQTNLNAKLKESTVIDGKILNERLSELMKTSLTKREMEVLIELCKGKENKEIAESLFISVNTVRTHLLKIYEKLDVKSRTQAIKKSENLSRIK